MKFSIYSDLWISIIIQIDFFSGVFTYRWKKFSKAPKEYSEHFSLLILQDERQILNYSTSRWTVDRCESNNVAINIFKWYCLNMYHGKYNIFVFSFLNIFFYLSIRYTILLSYWYFSSFFFLCKFYSEEYRLNIYDEQNEMDIIEG